MGKIRALSVAFVGSQEIVSVHCYAMESDFQSYMPTFAAVNESFQYDPGYRFVSGSEPVVRRGGGNPILGALIGAAIAALAGGLVYLLKRFFKRKEKAPHLDEA